MSDFFFGCHHHTVDHGAQLAAKDAQEDARRANTDVDFLKAEVDRLYMVTEALWMILKKATKLDDKALIDVVTEIDMRDGVLDGRSKVHKAPTKCPNCGRVLAKRRPLCAYCGAIAPKDPFER